MIKQIFFIFILSIVLAQGVLPFQVSAQTNPTNEYMVLAPLPGTTNKDNCVAGNQDCKTSLEKYLPGVFKLAIGLAAAATVLRIIFGGFLYMTSDALSGKSEGKAMIWNSIKGLVLVIGAWLILNTINPELLSLRLTIDSAEVKAPPAGSGGTLSTGATPGRAMTEAEVAESNRIRNYLALPANGVGTYTGPCEKGQPTGCVNLNGLTQTAENGVISLRREFGQFINITGGTELSIHSPDGDHPKGNSLDFGRASNPNYEAFSRFIISRGGVPTHDSKGREIYTIQINGSPVTFLDENDHWHVTFK